MKSRHLHNKSIAPELSLRAKFLRAFARYSVVRTYGMHAGHTPIGVGNAFLQTHTSPHIISPLSEWIHKIFALFFSLFVVGSVAVLIYPDMRVVVGQMYGKRSAETRAVLQFASEMPQAASAAIVAPDVALSNFISETSQVLWGKQELKRGEVQVQVVTHSFLE
jgi:hypothetical protein